MWWPRDIYVSTRRSAFHASVASFFVWHVKRCACGHPRSFRFCNGSEFGSGRPDVMVSVRWLSHAEPTLWLEEAERQVAVKSWNSLSACFYGRVSSIQHKKFFRHKIFCYEWFSSDIYEIYTTPLCIKSRMILECKVTLLVLKLINESDIFSVVFVTNFSWRKVYYFFYENRVQHTRRNGYCDKNWTKVCKV